MTQPEGTGPGETGPADARHERRQYNSAVRREQSANTRKRILAAGLWLVQAPRSPGWPALTLRAVAAQAEVNERTVYRYFGSERELRDAVLDQIYAESGTVLASLRLADIAGQTRRVLEYFSSFPRLPGTPPDPGFEKAAQRKRDALLRAVRSEAGQWAHRDQVIAAAMLDLLWDLRSYQGMREEWELESGDAIDGITWLIGLVEDAIRGGRPPAG
jgi:AcrR family transcriptional regulator